MAAAAVGEAFLLAFIEIVLDRLASPEVLDLIRGKKVEVNLIQRLKNTLYAVEAVLNDAEHKQFKDSAVNKWLDDLKDAVYVADDILDHISTKAATSWKNKEKQVSTLKYFSRFFNFEERDMFCKLENIVARLVMHDLVHDLATLLGGEFYYRTEELGNERKIGTKTRHFSFSTFTDPISENFDVFGRAKHLRTFLTINFDHPPFKNEKAPCIILLNLKCLRVLSFSHFPYLDALPDSIGELIHLCYLDISKQL